MANPKEHYRRKRLVKIANLKKKEALALAENAKNVEKENKQKEENEKE